MDEAKSNPTAEEVQERFRKQEAEREVLVQTLWKNLKECQPSLEKLLSDEALASWSYDDGIYRFYHQSFKVFDRLQPTTEEIVGRLKALLPGRPLNKWFMTIVGEGTGKKFDLSMNKRWLEETRPILEAFFHAKFFLEMAVKCARTMKGPEEWMESSWAAFLYLYDLR